MASFRVEVLSAFQSGDTGKDILDKGPESSNALQNDSPNKDILSNIRLKNVNRLLIGNLNINSVSGKVDQLKVLIQGKLDILVITETKLDSSFPKRQFLIESFSEPYRLDRNTHGGGVLIYVATGRYP